MDKKDILKTINGKRPQTVLLSGSPGAGKTTFLEAFAHQWSREHENFMTNPEENAKPEHTIVVFAPATDLKGDVWTSIERYVCCDDEEERKLISKHLKKDRSSAILLDALDEIREPEILSNLKKFIEYSNKNGGPQIVVSARTGLSRLTDRFIDWSLQLKGYTPQQGLKYIEVFIGNHIKQEEVKDMEPLPSKRQRLSMSKNTSQTSNCATESELFCPGKVHGYMLDHKKEMNAILCNPLRVHITCGLAVEGVLKLDKDGTLKPLYLQKCLEEFVLKRETRGNVVPPKDRLDFYKLCLHGLLAGKQSFTQIDLETFDVPSDSPYMAFFNTYDKPDEFANNVTYHSFVHETFYEYFAVRCFEELPYDHKKAFILAVFGKVVFKNVRVMICQILSQNETEETLTGTVAMFRVMLLLQVTHDDNIRKDPLKLKSDIQENLPKFEALLLQRNVDTDSFKSKVDMLWEKIDSQFTHPSGKLKSYWESLLLPDNGNIMPDDEINTVVREFSQEQLIYILKNTIHMLLSHET